DIVQHHILLFFRRDQRQTGLPRSTSSSSVKPPAAAPMAPPIMAPVTGLPPTTAPPTAPAPAPMAPPLNARSAALWPQAARSITADTIAKVLCRLVMKYSFCLHVFHFVPFYTARI